MAKKKKYRCTIIWSIFLILSSLSCVNNNYNDTCVKKSHIHELNDNFATKDPNEILRSRYPTLFVIPITPRDANFHAQSLMKAEAKAEVAYHIIALGILGQNTREVMIALDYANTKFGGKPVPNHFDWPDMVESFKQELAKDPELVVADWPGSRDVHFSFLIGECIDRIMKSEDISNLQWTVEEE